MSELPWEFQEREQNLEKLVREANGMLPMPVYQKIFEVASGVSGGNFVEIGTAHGASSITIALGASMQTRNFCVWTVDQLGGRFSSRRAFGSPEENRLIIDENFSRANVADRIHLFVGSSKDFIDSELCPNKIDFLLLDADGRIDRDLAYFYDRMSPKDIIVIDDVDDRIYFSTDHDGVPYIDLKHKISNLLLRAYEDAGFLKVKERVENTAFCERGHAPFDSNIFSEISTSCYHDLIFSTVDDPLWCELMRWKEDSRNVRLAVRAWQMIPRPILSGLRWIYRTCSSLILPRH